MCFNGFLGPNVLHGFLRPVLWKPYVLNGLQRPMLRKPFVLLGFLLQKYLLEDPHLTPFLGLLWNLHGDVCISLCKSMDFLEP